MPLGPRSRHTFPDVLGYAITVPTWTKMNEIDFLGKGGKRHRSLSLTDCPPWGPSPWRRLALCKNLQTQSIPLQCGPDCRKHRGCPQTALRVGFMDRGLRPGYNTRAPVCFEKGQVPPRPQHSITPHLRRPLREETNPHSSLLNLTSLHSDSQ